MKRKKQQESKIRKVDDENNVKCYRKKNGHYEKRVE